MKKTSFWESLGNTFETIIIIKYVIPFIVILFIILFGIALVYKFGISTQVDKENSILYTDLRNTVYNIASQYVNKNEFDIELEELDSYSMHEIEINYYAKNKSLSAEQYSNLLKTEITNVYNEIGNKELVEDTLFGQPEDMDHVDICFNIYIGENNLYDEWIGFADLEYSIQNKWNTSYQNIMESELVTQEKLDKALSNLGK